jgi:inhibitor of cysteine peptidase
MQDKTKIKMTSKDNVGNFIMVHEEEILTIKRGEKFTIILESNPTSGYRWIPTFNRSIINLISHDFQPSQSTRIGCSGKDIFTFLATSVGSEKLMMFYKRSWEKQFVAEKAFVINVK